MLVPVRGAPPFPQGHDTTDVIDTRVDQPLPVALNAQAESEEQAFASSPHRVGSLAGDGVVRIPAWVVLLQVNAQALQRGQVKMIAIPRIAVMPSKAHGVRTVPVPTTTVAAAMAATPGERRVGWDE
jgi:hypothetical protein